VHVLTVCTGDLQISAGENFVRIMRTKVEEEIHTYKLCCSAQRDLSMNFQIVEKNGQTFS